MFIRHAYFQYFKNIFNIFYNKTRFYIFWKCQVMQVVISWQCVAMWLLGSSESFKEIVHPKIVIDYKMYLLSGQPRCRWVSSLEKFWRNVALHNLLTNGSSAVNGCRQNESPDKNITVIHTTPVHQLTSCEVKSCVFVRTNPSLRCFNFKRSVLAKIWVHDPQ